MTNFDFHNLLFPTEFENLCRDILEIKETGTTFTTYKSGKDGGVDIKSTNTKEKIIGQCKLYNPNNYSELLSALKREVKKCHKQQPDRYIVCVNIEMTPNRVLKIKKLFGDYIKSEEDIIDGIKLNKYLNHKKYEHLFKSYSKLLVPNFQTIELALESVVDKVVNRRVYEDTIDFLSILKHKRKLFHYTSQIPFLIEQLEKNKVIILSGNPGVGKTTTAMIIANYFLSEKVKDIVFLQEEFDSISRVKSDNRLIIVDDFWGQNFSPSVPSNYSTYERKFQRTIESFTHSNNRYLILTSRDYIIKDILSKNLEIETTDLLTENKYIINVEDYTLADKIRILMNHLLFYDFDLSYFSDAIYYKDLKYIVNHNNYSPRHLEFFIKQYQKRNHQSSYYFYSSLHKYLDNPTTFWNETFQKLNPTSKTILLTLLVSGGIMSIEDLKNSFDDIQIKAREILNENIIPTDFYRELAKLEELYLTINKNNYHYDILIEFQSPGIKDYLLEYLRHEGYLWIHVFIVNASYFNQLTFAFSTREEKIIDYESDYPLFGEKIVLSQNLRILLKQKLLLEFDDLNFCNHEGTELTDQLTRYHSAKETKYFKLIELNNLFPIYIEDNKDVKKVIIEKVLIDIENYDGKIVDSRSMIYFPSIIKLVFPYLDYSPNKILKIFYNSITFASEYQYFYSFKDIFPKEFKQFYDSEIKKIRNHIKELIFDDIDYYLDEEDGYIGEELDLLLNIGIEELKRQYKFRITEKFLKELERNFEIGFSNLRNGKQQKKPLKSSRNHKKTPIKKQEVSYEEIIQEYLPEESYEKYSTKLFLQEQGFESLLKTINNKQSGLFLLKNNRQIFEPICYFISNQNINTLRLDTYHLINQFFLHHCKKVNLQPQLVLKIGNSISDNMEQNHNDCFTKSTFFNIIEKSNFSITDISLLEPFIVSYKNWYKFSHSDIEIYFRVKYLNSLSLKDFTASITEYLEPEESTLLDFLQSSNKEKLWNYYIIPEINRLLDAIDFTNQKSILHSFANFFKIEFGLEWDKKEKVFYSYGSSYNEYHYENILNFCGIQFSLFDFETYFEKDHHIPKIIDRLNIKKKAISKLYKRILNSIPKKKVRMLISNEYTNVFEIKLSDFINNDENFKLIKDIGMVSYVNNLIEKLKNISTNS